MLENCCTIRTLSVWAKKGFVPKLLLVLWALNQDLFVGHVLVLEKIILAVTDRFNESENVRNAKGLFVPISQSFCYFWLQFCHLIKLAYRYGLFVMQRKISFCIFLLWVFCRGLLTSFLRLLILSFNGRGYGCLILQIDFLREIKLQIWVLIFLNLRGLFSPFLDLNALILYCIHRLFVRSVILHGV